MMKKIAALTLLFTIFKCYPALSQETTEKITVKLGGFVRSETIYDTYQSWDSRDGEVYYYPKRRNLDISGKDINQTPQLEMLALQSRLKITGDGVTALGAKATTLLESDFFGTAEDYKFMLRIRHAMIKFDWEKTQLLIGQWWHPMTISEFSPNTVSFASGVTYQPQNRAVQVRITQQVASNFKMIGALLAHAYHRSKEIPGYNSQRNSGLPDMQAQVQYGSTNSLFFALTGGYKFLKPYLTTTRDSSIYKATKIVGSYNLQVSFGYQFPQLSFKLQGVLGQNLTNYSLIGGYSPIKGTDNEKGEYDFANMITMSIWTDVETKGEKLKFGLFAGYSENLGSKDSLILDTRLCRDADLKQIFRIAPRFYVISGPIDFAFEYMLCGAIYGTFQGKAIKNTDDPVINHRILASVRYSF